MSIRRAHKFKNGWESLLEALSFCLCLHLGSMLFLSAPLTVLSLFCLFSLSCPHLSFPESLNLLRDPSSAWLTMHAHVEAGAQPCLSFLRSCPPCILKQSLSLAWNSLRSLHWLAQESQGFTYFAQCWDSKGALPCQVFLYWFWELNSCL